MSLAAAISFAAASVACGGGGGSPGAGNNALVTLNTTSVESGTTGVAYSQLFEASVPHHPGLFIVTGGSLPPGLTLNKQTGELSGYPRQIGTYHFQLAARDGADPSVPQGRDANFAEDRKSYVLPVGLGAPHILPQLLPGAQYRASYGYQLDVAGGTAPYQFAMTGGSLPTGLSVSSTGFIGSFPTQFQAAPFTFQVQVTDANGQTDVASLSLQVFVLPLAILTPETLTQAAFGFPYDQTISLASGGGGPPYTWTQLPPIPMVEVSLASIGMALNPLGHIVDTGAGPTQFGTFKFTVQVTDEAVQSVSRQFTLKVNPGPVLNTLSPNRGSSPGPFTATGLNFQPGAQLIFKPGAGQSLITPTFVNATTLTFSAPVPVPSAGAGAVDVMVKNPDGGNFTKPTAFIFPAATVSFNTKGFASSTLSSTGLDAADVTGDGKADIVHCGAGSYSSYSGSAVSPGSGGGLEYLRNLGTSPVTFSTTALSAGSFTDVKFADVNLDGKLDIIGLGQSSIQVWFNGTGGNPLGTFSASPVVSTLYTGGTSVFWPSEMAVGKLDGDGVLDVVYGAVYYNGGGYTSGRCFSMFGNVSGAFSPLDAAINTMVASTQANYTYGFHTVACLDLDNNGRSEVLAGTGNGYYTGTYPALYSVPSGSGTFGSWVQKGTTIASPQYPGIQGSCVGDFLGTGSPQAIVAATGAPGYSNTGALIMLSGSSIATSTTLAYPGARPKSMCVLDADFDAKLDWVVSVDASSVVVYRGSTQAIVATLNAASGSPALSSPKTGRVASGDFDGDGKPDLVATCSYWAGEGMAAWTNNSTYALGLNGDGGQKGVVFYLNTSN